MQEITRHFDAKTITAGGGILLAALTIIFAFQVQGSQANENSRDIKAGIAAHEVSESTRDTALIGAIKDLTKAVDTNTQAVRDLSLRGGIKNQ